MTEQLFIYPTAKDAIEASAKHWIDWAELSIQQKGAFHVALSGGSTPKAIYTLLLAKYINAIDWTKVHLYWSDERNLPSNHIENNYCMAMQAGFGRLPILKDQIHPVLTHLEASLCAQEYNALLSHRTLDLIMLGMGSDGHTASLFPHSEALKIQDRYFAVNYIENGKTLRFTMTYPCLRSAKCCGIYVWGKEKSARIKNVLCGPLDIEEQPIQGMLTRGASQSPPVYWMVDAAAAKDYTISQK